MNCKILPYTTYSEAEILPLYESAGWTNYTRDPAMLQKAYENSLLTLAAFDDGCLVGAVRVVGDGASVVFVQDLLVLPQYRRKGIGTALLHAVLERFEGVYQLHLLTDNTPETVAFYRAVGLVPVEDLGCRAFTKVQKLPR